MQKAIIGIPILLLLLCFSNKLAAAKLILAKKQDGNKRCIFSGEEYYTRNSDNEYSIEFKINIKNISGSSSSDCLFPWKIKAQVGDVIFAESPAINLQDFELDGNLLTTSSSITIPQNDLRQFEQVCFTNSCHDLLTTLSIVFKLYSNNEEIDINCIWFNDPELEPGSNSNGDIVHFLGCVKTENTSPPGSRPDTIPDSTPPVGKRPRASKTNNSSQNQAIESAKSNLFLQKGEAKSSTKSIIFPNPTSGKLNLKLETSTEGFYTAQILSYDGRIQKHFQLNNSFSTIDLTALPEGLYLLRVSCKKFTSTHQFVLRNPN